MTQQVKAFAAHISWLEFDSQNPQGRRKLTLQLCPLSFPPVSRCFLSSSSCSTSTSLSPPSPPSLPLSPHSVGVCVCTCGLSLSLFHYDDDNDEEDNKIKTKNVNDSCLFPPPCVVYSIRFYPADSLLRVLNRVIIVEHRNTASRIFSLQECNL